LARISTSLVMIFRTNGHLLVGSEDDDVGIRADRDRSLSRKQSEDFRLRRRRDLHEAVERDPSLGDAAVVNQRHAMLHSRPAIRNLREIVFAELLLLLETERTV